MNIALCEDQIKDMEEIKIVLRNTTARMQLDVNTDFFHSGEELIRAIENGHHYSLLLLDIFLGGINGIQTAYKIRFLMPEVHIAFMTVSHEHAVDAFDLNAVHYMIKPIAERQMRECLERFLTREGLPIKALTIKSDSKTYTFMLSNVQKIQSRNKGIDVYLQNGKKTCHIPISFKRAEEQLDPRLFLKISRGLIVQMPHILCIERETCRLRDGTEAIISRRERAAIRKKYNDYLFRS